jgi:hypothetical protein
MQRHKYTQVQIMEHMTQRITYPTQDTTSQTTTQKIGYQPEGQK